MIVYFLCDPRFVIGDDIVSDKLIILPQCFISIKQRSNFIRSQIKEMRWLAHCSSQTSCRVVCLTGPKKAPHVHGSRVRATRRETFNDWAIKVAFANVNMFTIG